LSEERRATNAILQKFYKTPKAVVQRVKAIAAHAAK
jgi:hypothetical protein